METLVTYGTQIVHAFVSPVNCIGNLGSDVLTAFGHFAQCVGNNLAGSAAGAADTSANIVNVAGTTIGSIGG